MEPPNTSSCLRDLKGCSRQYTQESGQCISSKCLVSKKNPVTSPNHTGFFKRSKSFRQKRRFLTFCGFAQSMTKSFDHLWSHQKPKNLVMCWMFRVQRLEIYGFILYIYRFGFSWRTIYKEMATQLSCVICNRLSNGESASTDVEFIEPKHFGILEILVSHPGLKWRSWHASL